jgi:hypothetical protein
MRIFRYTMCSTYIRGLGALAAALMLLAFVSARAQTAGGHWTVSAVDGTATITGHGSEGFAASRGQPVVAGTTIATDDDGTVVLTRRGDSITVYPNSQMTVPASTGTEELGILQSFGTLLFRMETRESRDFEVKTPYLAATIKGTTFTVTVGKASAAVSVTEGMVLVEPVFGGRREMVYPGWTATVDIGSKNIRLAENRRSMTDEIAGTEESSAGFTSPDSSATGNSPPGNSSPGNSGPGNSSPGNSGPGNSSPGNSGPGNSSPGNDGRGKR